MRQDFAGDRSPAANLGVVRVWINRFGKSGDPAYPPNYEFSGLSVLPGLFDR